MYRDRPNLKQKWLLKKIIKSYRPYGLFLCNTPLIRVKDSLRSPAVTASSLTRIRLRIKSCISPKG